MQQAVDLAGCDVADVFRATKGPIGRPDRPATLDWVAFVSTMLPQRCGLATFTADLMAAVRQNDRGLRQLAVPVSDGGPSRGTSPGPAICKHEAESYAQAGVRLRQAGAGLLCVQHEYGIFGGPDGAMLLDLLSAAAGIPVVVTLHTVLERPSPNQHRVLDTVLARAARVIVMTQRSAAILERVHGLSPERIALVPHGIPPAPDRSRADARHALGLGTRPTLLTFGLLSPGKGIEHAIRAMPALVRRWPDLMYLVVGATHPNLVRENGEAYRDSLAALADQLGVAANMRFVNRFVDLPELTDALVAADVYLTPYVNEAQSVSGTLSYSYGLGTPVVSTPYHHAVELLADGRGTLVPFADPDAISAAVAALLADPARRGRMREAARRDGQRMSWPNVGASYLGIFRDAVSHPMVSAR